MRRFSRYSVRVKLMGVVLLTTLVALLAALAALITYDLRTYHRQLAADMGTQAELLGRASAPALAFDDAKLATENLALLRLRPQVRAAALYNARGTTFATYLSPEAGLPEIPKLPEGDGVRVEGRRLFVFRRIVENGEILGTVYVCATYEMYDRVLDYLGIAAVVLAGAMLIALGLSAQLQRVVTRPILAIAQIALDVIDRRDYSRRAQKISRDEVGALAEAFNAMLAEIERRTRALESSNQGLEHEVAERRRAEEEVQRLNAELEKRVRERTAQLEAANKELEAFSFSVSHDLRAPLRAIDGFSQALLEDFPKNVSDEANRYLLRIQSSTQRMGQLIEDLLNLARVSRGALSRRTVDVSSLARQVVVDLQQRDPGRTVEVSIWDGLSADADPRLLRAALENLIGNAWKFTSKAASPRIEIGALHDGGQTTFFVRDNGAGFDMAYSDKLFGAFQRLHAANDYTGTGIGLATVQRIVHRHGGRIWADAQVGKGAVFHFTLPESAEQSAEEERTGSAG
jgi:signal transduction histidine kinase